MVGSILELVCSLPPHLPPQASILVSLKEETKFPHLSRGPPHRQTECPVVTVCQATHDIQELSLPLNQSAVSDTSMRSCPSARWKWGRESHCLRLLFTLLLLPIGQSFTKSLLCAQSWGCVRLRCRRSKTGGACSLEPCVSQLNTSTFELEGLPVFKLKKFL